MLQQLSQHNSPKLDIKPNGLHIPHTFCVKAFWTHSYKRCEKRTPTVCFIVGDLNSLLCCSTISSFFSVHKPPGKSQVVHSAPNTGPDILCHKKYEKGKSSFSTQRLWHIVVVLERWNDAQNAFHDAASDKLAYKHDWKLVSAINTYWNFIERTYVFIFIYMYTNISCTNFNSLTTHTWLKDRAEPNSERDGQGETHSRSLTLTHMKRLGDLGECVVW